MPHLKMERKWRKIFDLSSEHDNTTLWLQQDRPGSGIASDSLVIRFIQMTPALHRTLSQTLHLSIIALKSRPPYQTGRSSSLFSCRQPFNSFGHLFPVESPWNILRRATILPPIWCSKQTALIDSLKNFKLVILNKTLQLTTFKYPSCEHHVF